MYRIQFRSIGRAPVEVFAETQQATSQLYIFLTGDPRTVSVAYWKPGDKAPTNAFDRSRPVVRERESVRIVRGDAESDALTGVRPL